MCLRVLKESNKSRFDRYSRQKQCIDHIPYYLSGLSRAHFSDNLSRHSCILKQSQLGEKYRVFSMSPQSHRSCCLRLLLRNFFFRKNQVTKTLCWQVTFILTITRTLKFFNLPIWGRSESFQSWAFLTLYFLPPWWRIFIHYGNKRRNQEVSETTKCLPST